MTAKLGQPIRVQITTGRWSIGAVSKIISGDTINVVAFSDGVNPWPTIDTFNGVVAGTIENVTKGTSVGQWQEVDLPDPVVAAIAAAVSGITGFATTSYVDSEIATAIAAIPADDDSGLCVVPTAGTSVSSPAPSTPRRPSTTRPTLVTVYATVALASALLAVQSATVEIQAGTSATPTTTVAGPLTPESGVGNVGTLKIPVTLVYLLPANHYYQVVKTAGAGTLTVNRIEETEQ